MIFFLYVNILKGARNCKGFTALPSFARESPVVCEVFLNAFSKQISSPRGPNTQRRTSLGICNSRLVPLHQTQHTPVHVWRFNVPNLLSFGFFVVLFNATAPGNAATYPHFYGVSTFARHCVVATSSFSRPVVLRLCRFTLRKMNIFCGLDGVPKQSFYCEVVTSLVWRKHALGWSPLRLHTTGYRPSKASTAANPLLTRFVPFHAFPSTRAQERIKDKEIFSTFYSVARIKK